MEIIEHKIAFLPVILDALLTFYNVDYDLIKNNRGVHEQTFTGRLAHYLAQRLENNKGYFVDCEYSRDKFEEDREYKNKKTIPTGNGAGKRHIRPDIVFHDRSMNNRFCIEAKWKGMRGDAGKVRNILNQYNYYEGYCIYNIGSSYVSINLFVNEFCKNGIKCRLKYNKTEYRWTLCEISCEENYDVNDLIEQIKVILKVECMCDCIIL